MKIACFSVENWLFRMDGLPLWVARLSSARGHGAVRNSAKFGANAHIRVRRVQVSAEWGAPLSRTVRHANPDALAPSLAGQTLPSDLHNVSVIPILNQVQDRLAYGQAGTTT